MIWADKSGNVQMEVGMVSDSDIAGSPVANYDSDRKGIFIHKNELAESGFKPGDRFSLKYGRQDLFAITIIKDDKGEIVFDKNGIFIKRTRRIDILLGGLYDDYLLYFESGGPGTIKLRPVEAVLKKNYM
jgi:hypothetical protein